MFDFKNAAGHAKEEARARRMVDAREPKTPPIIQYRGLR